MWCIVGVAERQTLIIVVSLITGPGTLHLSKFIYSTVFALFKKSFNVFLSAYQNADINIIENTPFALIERSTLSHIQLETGM